MSKSGWDDATLAVVRGVWALVIATVMIAGAIFYVLPHLIEDGTLSRDDVLFLAGIFVLAFVMALPSVFMQALGAVVGAYRTWRTNGRNGGGT